MDNKELNQEEAIKVLIKAVQLAQSKGAFNLDEASVIHKAIKTFIVDNEIEIKK